MKKGMALFLAALLLACSFLSAACSERPFDTSIAEIRGVVADTVGTDTVGAAILFQDNGEVRMLEGYGYADISDRRVVTADTAFALGRLSSIFVALAVDELSRTGALRPQEDIARYLPAEVMEKLSLAYSVTTNDLLYGTAGFEGRLLDLYYTEESYRFETLEEALLANVPRQVAEPGTYYNYSAFGIGLAALVVEYVSGTSYEAYVEKTILSPLGMNATLLAPRSDTLPDAMAVGHTASGEGSFAVAQQEYRFSAIAPADGAISTAFDLSLLVAHLLSTAAFPCDEYYNNGIFTIGAAGLVLTEGILSAKTVTDSFGGAFCLDAENGRAVLVLTNCASSKLLDLPRELCDVSLGVSLSAESDLPDVNAFAGTYFHSALERDSLLGRLRIKDNGIRVQATEEGTLLFEDAVLYQIRPGIFAAEEGGLATVQFLLDDKGEVRAMLTADGETFLRSSFDETTVPSLLLFLLLIVGALYFLCGAVWGAVSALQKRNGQDSIPALRFLLTWVLSGLTALFVLLQIIVAITAGEAAFASFFVAMSVIAIILATLAALSYVFAIFTSFTERGRTSRLVGVAILFLVFLLLCAYWRVIYL